MNDTAAELGNQTNSMFSNTSPGVIIVLALVALLAVVTVVGLLYGARQKSRRKQVEAEVEEHTQDQPEPVPGTAQAAPSSTTAAPQARTEERQAPAPPLPDEPVPATDAMTANPASEAAASTNADADADAGETMAAEPVTILKGLGPKVAAQLAALGVTTVGDIAALDDRAAQDLDARLGAFTGRMTRDRWLEQARLLAAGDRKGFEDRFGKL